MGFCHVQVAEVAKGLCGETYELAARDNAFFARHPKLEPFVREYWGHFVKPARAVLGAMLKSPNYPESMKQEIYEALLLDNTAPSGRNGKSVVNYSDKSRWV